MAVPTNAPSPSPTESSRRPPAVTRLLLRAFVAYLAAFALLRALFFILHGDRTEGLSAGLVIRAFVTGLRFDLAGVCLLLLPWAALALVPLLGRRGARWRSFLLNGLVATGFAAVSVGVGDVLYYGHAAKRISYEPLVLWTSGGRLALTAFKERPLVFPLLIAGCLIATVWLWRSLRRREATADDPATRPRLTVVAWGMLVTALLVLGLRGGLGNRLRIGDGYFSDEPLANHASLNSIYSFFCALKDDRTLYDLMPMADAIRVVRDTVRAEGEHFSSDQYPMMRTSVPRRPAQPADVVLILAESLTAETMGIFGNRYDATPNLDRIASEGVLFDRFVSSGSRSSHGLFATLFSVPAQLGGPVLHSSLIMNRFRGLPTILSDFGYETTFIYGGVYEFTNAYGVLKQSGFERIISEPDPSLGAKPYEWGYHDEPMFRRVLAELDRPRERPRLTVFFTQSLHNRDLPEEYLTHELKERFPESMKSEEHYRLLSYTDTCFGMFFDEARKRDYFDHTIFVIVSDHTNHKNPHLYENYHIPCIIYAPWLLEPARSSMAGSQLDVLPTLLGLPGIETQYAAFGRDLFDPSRDPGGFAYLTFGDSVGFIEGTRILQEFKDGSAPKLYDYVDDVILHRDLASELPDVTARLSQKAHAHLQLSRQLLVEDRIFGDISPAADASAKTADGG